MTDLSDQQWLGTAQPVRAPAPANRPPSGPAPDCVVFRQVGKRYASPQGEVSALQDVDFSIQRGEVFGIIGRSGAGKSTLLRTINRLERPSSGKVLVRGQDIAALDETRLQQERRQIGMIFQHFNLLSARTVWQNVALPLQVAGVPAKTIAQRVNYLLDMVGLSAKHGAYPAKLSGGQKQRVGIARALVHEPDILLCDEATSALDPETTQSILALLREINARLGLTVVLITHEMRVIRDICDRVAVMDQGRVVEIGPVWRVFGAPQADATRALLQPMQPPLPEDVLWLVQPLQPGQQAPAGAALLIELQWSGIHRHDPALHTLTQSLGGAVSLVHGGIDRIQGRPQGRLVIEVAAQQLAGEAVLERLAAVADHARILGWKERGTP